MNRDRIWILLTGAFAVMMAFLPDWGGIFGALAIPFVALGWALRTLSLSGPVGNMVSLILYGLICLIPLAWWRRSRRRTEDWLLVLLCGVLAMVLYYMVNPNMRSALLQNRVGDAIFSFPVWGTLTAWGVLKLLYSGKWVLERNIYRALRIFLLLCASACLIDCFGIRLANLIREMGHYTGMIQYPYQPGPTVLFLLLEYLAAASEKGLCALVLYKGVKLLDRLEEDPFSEACVRTANDVGEWCRRVLTLTCLASLTLNMGQLMLSPLLPNIRMNLLLPVQGMAVSFSVLAVTRLLIRGKELKDDNDLFV